MKRQRSDDLIDSQGHDDCTPSSRGSRSEGACSLYILYVILI